MHNKQTNKQTKAYKGQGNTPAKLKIRENDQIFTELNKTLCSYLKVKHFQNLEEWSQYEKKSQLHSS